MRYTGKNNLSRLIYWLCALLMCYASFFFYPKWQQKGGEAAISWDVSGYYWYLPSVFIYKDLEHQSFKDNIFSKYDPTGGDFQQAMKVDNGNYVMKYSSGMAVMYLPFFTAAHLVAGALGYPRDGFSAPYQFAIQFGGLLVALLGLWYLRKLLLLYYSDKVVAIVLGLLVFGSNYLDFAAIDCGMSHSWLFTIYVFILLNTHYFYQSFKLKHAIRIGLLVGLAALTRPSDLISCLIPLLWGLESLRPAAIKNHLALVIKNYRALLIAGVCAAIVISVQVIYWKYASGHWIVYSYNNQHLYFRSPNFRAYTFSYRSGWLIYSPMMILAFTGIIPYLFKGKNKVAVIAFFLINYYIVCSWNIWWYGGRAMIQSYPVLLFCVAALVKTALDRKALLWVLTPVVLVFVYFNIWITYQYHRGKLYEVDNMSRAYFWRVVGRWSAPENVAVLKENPDLYEDVANDMRLVYHNDFSNDTGAMYRPHATGRGKSLYMDKDHQCSPIYSFAYSGDHNATWLRVQATLRSGEMEYVTWKMPQFIVRLIKNKETVYQDMQRVYRSMGANQTKDVTLDVHLPDIAYDSVNVLFMDAWSDTPLWVDDIKVWRFRE